MGNLNSPFSTCPVENWEMTSQTTLTVSVVSSPTSLRYPKSSLIPKMPLKLINLQMFTQPCRERPVFTFCSACALAGQWLGRPKKAESHFRVDLFHSFIHLWLYSLPFTIISTVLFFEHIDTVPKDITKTLELLPTLH